MYFHRSTLAFSECVASKQIQYINIIVDYLSQEIETQHLVAAGWDLHIWRRPCVPNRQMLKPSLSTLFRKASHWRCSSELLPHQNVVLRHTHEDETEKEKNCQTCSILPFCLTITCSTPCLTLLAGKRKSQQLQQSPHGCLSHTSSSCASGGEDHATWAALSKAAMCKANAVG